MSALSVVISHGLVNERLFAIHVLILEPVFNFAEHTYNTRIVEQIVTLFVLVITITCLALQWIKLRNKFSQKNRLFSMIISSCCLAITGNDNNNNNFIYRG